MKEEAERGAGSLPHLDDAGAARMVDVSRKDDTLREAVATGRIRMRYETLRLIGEKGIAKGDVVAVARVAGIMAAKKTAELVPLCHPVAIQAVELAIEEEEALPGLLVRATVRSTGPTGVEMEALTAVSVSLLTIYDMAKGVDFGMEMGDISVLTKTGGKSGPWQRA